MDSQKDEMAVRPCYLYNWSDEIAFCIETSPLVMQEVTWWRHQMETFSALLVICAGNSPVTGEFPAKRPVTRSFELFFDLSLNKRLSKQSWGWWFETPSCPLWCHCNVQPSGHGAKCTYIYILWHVHSQPIVDINCIYIGGNNWGTTSFIEESFSQLKAVNSSPPGQNGRHFADDMFKRIFLNESICILNKFRWNMFLGV